MRFVELESNQDVENAEIRQRAMLRRIAPASKHFLGYKDGKQVVFISLDLRPDLHAVSLYEIFVPKAMRRNGVGAEALGYVADLSQKWGFERVLVLPTPFEQDFPKEKLVQWYKDHGYVASADVLYNLEKVLT
jgi:GNAT superfamily N-acetyltransferase